jgi:hypothetical protein
MAGFLFNQGAYQLASGGTVWASDTIKARLITTAAGAPSVDADTMSGIGVDIGTYPNCTTTLSALAGPTLDDTNDVIRYSSADALFTSAELGPGACSRMAIYEHVAGGDANCLPLACVEITSVTPNGGNITVTCPTSPFTAWFYLDQQP